MSVFHENMLIGSSGQGGAAAAYTIQRSLRFNSADSASISRAFSSAGNRRTWTWAGWVKRSALGGDQVVFAAGASNNEHYGVVFASDSLATNHYVGSQAYQCITSAVFRDVSAWYHVLVAYDSTQATASNRIKIYVNGSLQTLSTANYPSLNYDGQINTTAGHTIAKHPNASVAYFNGLLADVFFIDGQALDPTSFTEVSATTGQLIPKQYTGSFGTNGFWLKFSDNSAATATTLGKDYSGNSNNWTPNNLSVTAGAGNDSLTDSPTSYGTDTGAGGEVRGNYCTLNPLRQATGSGASLANGNLDFTCVSATTGSQTTFATFGVSSGKYYFEMTVGTAGGYYPGIGINTDLSLLVTSQSGDAASGYMYLRDGSKYRSGSITSYGSSYTTGDVIGVAFDLDAGTITFYKNGSSQGQAFSGITGTAVPCIVGLSSASGSMNFGQRSWAYAAPSGFKALCTANLPTPTIANGATAMDVALWTGNGSARSITGLQFSPDWVWLKSRSAGGSYHKLYDTVRGATKLLNGTNDILAESTETQGLTAFNSDGFSLGTDANHNGSGATFVGWCWDAGSSTVTNTQGSITSQVRANPSAGFSIVQFTSQASGAATVGHGLGVAPQFIIQKIYNIPNSWLVYHHSLGNTQYVYLNLTNAAAAASSAWNNTSPTSSVYSLGSGSAGGYSIISYCFAPVAGYSSFGSYTGNGSTDGPMVYTGFRPRWIMFKRTDTTADWLLIDTARDSFNAAAKHIHPNLSNAEATGSPPWADILSNGFKLRNSYGETNASGGTYVYASFSEHPFSLARAR